MAGSGKSNSAALLPGQTFSLTEHPNGSLNTDWQIVRIQHTGLQPQALEEEGGSGPTVYHNEFGVVKASTTWRARIGSPEAKTARTEKVTSRLSRLYDAMLFEHYENFFCLYFPGVTSCRARLASVAACGIF